MPEFAGFVHTAAGAGSDGLVIKLYARNDHAGTSVADTTTNSNGYWAISHGTEGLFDVEVVIDDSNKYRIRYDDQIQCELGEFGQLYLRGTNDAFATKLVSTPTASRTITFPDATATALLGGYANTNTGVMSLTSTANSAAAVYLRANGGTSETIKIHSDQGTSVTEGAESVNILSDAGGVGIRSTANLAKAVNITSDGGTTGSIAIFNDQGTSVTEGAESISVLSDAGGIGIRSTANLANAVNITVDGGTTSTMTLFNDQGTAATEGAASIQLLSDVGGINIKSGLNAADAILLTADGGTSEKIRIHADQGTGVDSIELSSDAGGIELNVVSSVGITGSAILDEDGMGSNSAIHLATQQSIKAYVDAQQDTVDTLAEILALSNTTGGTDIIMTDGDDLNFGSGGDIMLRHSGAVSANAEVTTIIAGTSVHPGVAADSLIVSNITASGDMMFATNRGGNTEAHMLFDASAGDTFLYARGVQAMKIAGGGVMTITPALTVTGALTNTAASVLATGTTIGNLTLANGSITDSSGAIDFGNENLTTTGVITAAGFTIGSGAITEAELEILDGASVTTAELNLIDGGTARGTDAIGDGDGVLINDDGTMKMTTVQTLAAYLDDEITAMPNLVTTGALTTGSIASGFGTINNGSNTITTTGAVATGALTATGDTIVGNGYGLVVGHTAQVTTGAITAEVQVLGTGDADSEILIGRYSANTSGPILRFAKGRDAIGATTTILDAGDALGSLKFNISDVTDNNYVPQAASIVVELDATPGQNDAPGRIKFSTTKDGEQASTEAMRITSTQGVHVYEWLALQNGKKLYFDTGSDTYIYEESADDLHITVGGAIMAQLDQEAGLTSFNPSAADYDFRVLTDNGTNAIHVDAGVNSTVGSVTIGYTANPDANNRAFFKIYPPAMTTASGKSTSWVGIQPDLVMTMAGTVPVAASLAIEEPNLSGTPTLAATLYIKDAPDEGTTNAAIYVAAGNTILADGTGLVVGHTALIAAATDTASFQVLGVGADTQITQGRWSNNAGAPTHVFAKSRGTTVGTWGTVVADGDTLGVINWVGDDGTDANSSAAQIYAQVDGSPGGNDMPGRIVLATTADGAASPTERMRIDSAGTVFIGETTHGSMGAGLVINVGATDVPGLVMKSSTDVAHGVQNLGIWGAAAETDDAWRMGKALDAGGGWGIEAFGDGGGNMLFHMIGLAGTNINNTHTAAAGGAGMLVRIGQHNGSNAHADVIDGANLHLIQGRVGGAWRTVWIVDENGNYWFDGAAQTAFDYEDDLSAVRAVDLLTADPASLINSDFDQFVTHNESDLVRMNILGDTVANGGLINGAALSRLHNGAISQLNTNHMSLAEKVDGLEVELIAAKKQLAAISA